MTEMEVVSAQHTDHTSCILKADNKRNVRTITAYNA